MVNSVIGVFPQDNASLIWLVFFIVPSSGCVGSYLQDTEKVAADGALEKAIESAIHDKNEEASRGHKKTSQQGGGIMQKLLPLLVVPFLISSAIIPGMLIAIKILLVKGLFTGVIAVVIMLLNILRSRVNGGGVFNHYGSNNLAAEHYGYQGIEEPGAYIHRKRRRRGT